MNQPGMPPNSPGQAGSYAPPGPAALAGQGDQIERRVERAVFETDGQLVVGDVTLPPAGYQSRFSDSLNRADLEFVPLTNAEITSLTDGQMVQRQFVMLSKRHIRVAYPLDEAPR